MSGCCTKTERSQATTEAEGSEGEPQLNLEADRGRSRGRGKPRVRGRVAVLVAQVKDLAVVADALTSPKEASLSPESRRIAKAKADWEAWHKRPVAVDDGSVSTETGGMMNSQDDASRPKSSGLIVP